jgi:cytochrome P450
LRFHGWRKEYGDIIGLKFGSKNVIVLNNYKHVREYVISTMSCARSNPAAPFRLFDKKGSVYSSRPDNHITSILFPNDIHILLAPYSSKWRALRKCSQQLLSITAVDKLLPIQDAEATQTLYDLVHNPEEYYDHIRRYSTPVILASVYGQRGATFNAPKVRALYHVQDQFTDLVQPGATPPIDEFPVLKYLPEFISPWKTRAKAIRNEQSTLYMALYHEAKAKIAQGKGLDCFMATLIKGQEKNGLNEEDIAYAGGAYVGVSLLVHLSVSFITSLFRSVVSLFYIIILY